MGTKVPAAHCNDKTTSSISRLTLLLRIVLSTDQISTFRNVGPGEA